MPPGGKTIHSRLLFLPLQADPGDEGQDKFVVKFPVYFFFMEICWISQDYMLRQ